MPVVKCRWSLPVVTAGGHWASRSRYRLPGELPDDRLAERLVVGCLALGIRGVHLASHPSRHHTENLLIARAVVESG
jgi:hypothetical protein